MARTSTTTTVISTIWSSATTSSKAAPAAPAASSSSTAQPVPTTSTATSSRTCSGGDGCITGVHYTLSGAVQNNTFIHVDNGYGNGDWIGHDVSAAVSNNVVYNGVAAFGANFTGTRDYNAYFSTTQAPSEAHGYTSSSNPFGSGSFQLTESAASAMPAGTTLASPYNLDPNGTVRGADGKWDRGAYERG